jgi:allantoinase
VTTRELIIRGGNVVSPDGARIADVAIAGGEIVEVASEISGPAREEIDARDLLVLPGAVDIHVHFNEPGRTAWEGWASGSAACAVGGTTTVAEMPLNAHPPTLDGPAFDAKRAAAEASSRVDFALWGGLTPENLDLMEELAGRGVIGFKAFMANSGIDDFLAADDLTLLEGMRRAAALELPVAVHAESDAITSALAARAQAAGRTSARDYLASRPAIAELEAISRAILFAAETGCALHVAHVSTGAGIAAIAEARARGVNVTAETCPHYFLFHAEDLERVGAALKCAPPLRSRDETSALWRALAAGDIQIVASDHSPAPPEMKAGDDFFRIWGGIAGCQSLLTALHSAGCVERGLPLPLLADVVAGAPARRLRLGRKGAIAPGHDADLVLVDPGERFTLERSDLHDRHRLNPFAGERFTGRPRRTILRGETIAVDGNRVGAPRGRPVRPA